MTDNIKAKGEPEESIVSMIEKGWKRKYIEWFFNHSPYFPIPNEQVGYIEKVLLSPLQERVYELESGIKKAMDIRCQPHGSGDYEILKNLIAGRSKSIESEKAKDERIANLESHIKELQIRYGDNWTPYANEITDKILNK